MRKILDILKFKEIGVELQNNPKETFRYNYLLGIAMAYMMFMILSGITVYKPVQIGIFIFPAAVLVTPFIYSLSNVVTEVYGYPVARNMLWWFIIVSAVFSTTGYLLSHAPSPQSFHNPEAFNLILGNMPLIFIAGTIGSLIGISFNNYVVSKYKIYLGGKKYPLRSILSTVGGEIVYNLTAYPIMFYGHLTMHQFINVFFCVTFFKLGTTGLIWPFECYFANFLKIKEGVNVFDYKVKYNIFRFHINAPSKGANLRVIR